MKKMNKNGFTIVELVIVIAVIAILAGVMIPTFAGIVEKAKQSAALQEAKNIMTEYIALKDGAPESKYYIKVVNSNSDYYFVVKNGKISGPISTTDLSNGIMVEKGDTNGAFPKVYSYQSPENSGETTEA